MLALIEDVIGNLGAAQLQRVASDDSIIAAHIDNSLQSARALLEMIRKVAKTTEGVL